MKRAAMVLLMLGASACGPQEKPADPVRRRPLKRRPLLSRLRPTWPPTNCRRRMARSLFLVLWRASV